MTDKHLTRSTIGPNTDRRAAIVALAKSLLDEEARRLTDAESDALRFDKRGRLVLSKACARAAAAQDLYNLAVAHAERRAYIFHDATQTPQEARQASQTAGVTTESSGQNQAVSDDDPDPGDQATVNNPMNEFRGLPVAHAHWLSTASADPDSTVLPRVTSR